MCGLANVELLISRGGFVPLTRDLVFCSVAGIDAIFLIRILFAGGTFIFDCDKSFTRGLVLFGILASKSDHRTLGGVNFVRRLDEVDACGKWNDNMELNE